MFDFEYRQCALTYAVHFDIIYTRKNQPEEKYKLTNVCFIGHSKLNDIDDTKEKTKKLIISLIDNGAKNFYFGGRGMFDFMCWKAVEELKNIYKHIKSYYGYENSNHARRSPKWLNKQDYDECILLDFFDKSYKAIYFRNCAMIDACDFCVFYAGNSNSSGAYMALCYAQKKKKSLVNLI